MRRKELYVDIGKRIREARQACRLTLQDVADALGIKPPTLQRYESGQRRVSIDLLFQLSEILDRPYTWFLGIQDQPINAVQALRGDPNLPAQAKNILVQLYKDYQRIYPGQQDPSRHKPASHLPPSSAQQPPQ